MTPHLVLIGLPGSGKTTVGRLAAAQLALPFADCDSRIESETGLSIPALFAQRGEPFFRAEESRILRQLLAGETCVIATGGGAVVAEENRKLLKTAGLVVLLDRNIRDIAGRVGNRERPLLRRYSLEQLAAQRRAWYLDCAGAVVRDGTAEELAAQIAGMWRRTCNS